jgi:uncharacterized protein (DUF1501 family)
MISRRGFLRSSLQTSTLIALAPTVPGFLAHAARAVLPARDARVLVVIQMEGGNDGINTVVPFADEGYAKHRKVLRLPTDKLLKLNKEVGLHPAMGDAAKLLETGRLAIVQGGGYPNPSRSHFKSMSIWNTAKVGNREQSRNEEGSANVGWLGQALDGGRRPTDGSADAAFVGTEDVPVALWGRRSIASSTLRPEDSALTLKNAAKSSGAGAAGDSALAAFVERSTLDAYASSQQMVDLLRTKDSGARYPGNGLGDRLRVVARLLKGGVGTRVFYTSQAWYDTHADQLSSQSQLLGELASALRAFLDDLAAADLAERVAVLCFSEFGRRVQENGSQGTDHGTAGPVFVAGPGVKAGLIGETPKLLDLHDGDLKMGIDFRRVYATVLEDWLGLSSETALAGKFERLPLFRA